MPSVREISINETPKDENLGNLPNTCSRDNSVIVIRRVSGLLPFLPFYLAPNLNIEI